MATITDSTEVRSILMEVVSPNIKKQFAEQDSLYNEFQSVPSEFVNIRGTRVVAHMAPNGSYRGFAEGGALAPGGSSTKKEMNIVYVRQSMGGVLTGDAISNTSQKALAKAVASRVAEDTDTFIGQIDQQIPRDGSYTLAVVTAASGTTITCANWEGVKNIVPGYQYEVYTSAGVSRGTFTATAVTPGTSPTITVDALPASTANTDLICPVGSYGLAITGLQKHVGNDTGTYQGLPRGIWPQLKGIVVDLGAATPTVSDLTAALNKAKYKQVNGLSRKANDYLTLSSPSQAQNYDEQAFDLIRFNGGGGNAELAFNSRSFKGMTWKESINIDDREIFFIRKSSFKRYILEEPGIWDIDGQGTLRAVPGFSSGSGSHYDKVVYYLTTKMNLGCDTPSDNVKITNAAANSSVSINY